MNTRDFTRVNYSVGASIRFGNEVVTCNIDNLSLRGMHLKSEHDLPLDIPVHVTVNHSNQPSLNVNARVVRREECGFALQIHNLNVDSFVQLRNIVTDNSKDKGAVMRETFKMLKCIY
jgi:hypothetical protein